MNDDIDDYPCPNVSYDGKCDYNKTEKLTDINEKDVEEEIDVKTFLVIFLVLCLFSIIIYYKFNQ